jgi:hypothetical protein
VLNTGLEFAAGTTDECKRLVGKLFTPGDILGAYRVARSQFKTGDIVLVVSESDPSGFNAQTRNTFVESLKQGLRGGRMPFFAQALVDKPAHSIVQLPFEEDAMWLVVARKGAIPVMCVIYVTPYETTTQAN